MVLAILVLHAATNLAAFAGAAPAGIAFVPPLVVSSAVVIPENAVSARIPNSNTYVSFVADGFVADKKELESMRKVFRDSIVLVGDLGGGARLTLLSDEQPEPKKTGAEWRKMKWKDGTPFEVGDIACAEVPIDVEVEGGPVDVSFTSWHALLPAGGYMLDLHVSMTKIGDAAPTFGREQFSAIVSSYSVAVMRRLDWKTYPPGILDLMNQAMRATDTKAFFDARQKAAAGDALTLFVKAELMREMRVSLEESTKNFQVAVAALEKSKQANGELLLPRIVALDGLGVSLQTADKYKESIPHFEKALKLVTGKNDDLTEVTAYNLACSYARMKNVPKACSALKIAIDLDPKIRKSALADKDFDAIKEAKEFQALVAEPTK